MTVPLLAPRRLLASAVVATAISIPAAPANSAAGPDSAAYAPEATAGAAWLAGELEEGMMAGFGGPDWGLSIDTLFALKAAGTEPKAADALLAQFEKDPDVYYTPDYYRDDAVRVASAAAKTLVAVEVGDADPRNFGDVDLVRVVQDTVVDSGRGAGRITDRNVAADNADVTGQAYAVIGLAGAGENDDAVIQALRDQQCEEGYFRSYLGAPGSTCDPESDRPNAETTGLALSALSAARSAGAKGLSKPIDDAVEWLDDVQNEDGSWGGGESPDSANAYSTGMITQALADAGAGASADHGATYLASIQADNEDSGLSGEVGAVAYNQVDFDAGVAAGLEMGRDHWRSASAKAILGLSQVGFSELAPPGLEVTVPTRFFLTGQKVPVRVAGLTDGEPYRVELAGDRIGEAEATTKGRGSDEFALPPSSRTGSRAVRVVGSSSGRTGFGMLRVVAPKTLKVIAKRKEISPGGPQRLVVRGLARDEPVTVTVDGKRVSKASARANAKGVLRVPVAASNELGSSKVRAVGAFPTRNGSVTYQVRP